MVSSDLIQQYRDEFDDPWNLPGRGGMKRWSEAFPQYFPLEPVAGITHRNWLIFRRVVLGEEKQADMARLCGVSPSRIHQVVNDTERRLIRHWREHGR